MAVGILILSDEGDKQVAALVAADQQEAKKLGESFLLPRGYRFMGIDTPKAAEWVSRAWDNMSETWEGRYNGQEGQSNIAGGQARGGA